MNVGFLVETAAATALIVALFLGAMFIASTVITMLLTVRTIL